MHTATVSKLKATLSKYLSRVKAGEEVIVTERGKPIAKIMPVTQDDSASSPHLLELARAGLARIGAGRLPDSFWKMPRPRDKRGAGVKVLIEDRVEGR